MQPLQPAFILCRNIFIRDAEVPKEKGSQKGGGTDEKLSGLTLLMISLI
jgi:hypothetical protein